jgi:hypothetical protein
VPPELSEISSSEIEAAVDVTPGIDSWCSGPDWILPVHRGFAPASEPMVIRHGDCVALLASYEATDSERLVAGMELWGFACPMLGRDLTALAERVAERLEAEPSSSLVLPGFPADLDLARQVAGPLSRLGTVGAVPGIVRRLAELDGEGWWQRRSPTFRRNLRKAKRAAEGAGVEFVDVSRHPDLMDRLLAIERRSWKGRDRDGITSEPMELFYRTMIDRLQVRHRCRCFIATLDGQDLGFILGGVRGDRYRGLQLSYVEAAAHLSIGNLLQAHQVNSLLCSGDASVYDLGMDMDYKSRWSDRTESSVTVVVRPPS